MCKDPRVIARYDASNLMSSTSEEWIVMTVEHDSTMRCNESRAAQANLRKVANGAHAVGLISHLVLKSKSANKPHV